MWDHTEGDCWNSWFDQSRNVISYQFWQCLFWDRWSHCSTDPTNFARWLADSNATVNDFWVLVQFSWATSDLWLIQQNKFYWISHRSMVAQLNCTVTDFCFNVLVTYKINKFSAKCLTFKMFSSLERTRCLAFLWPCGLQLSRFDSESSVQVTCMWHGPPSRQSWLPTALRYQTYGNTGYNHHKRRCTISDTASTHEGRCRLHR